MTIKDTGNIQTLCLSCYLIKIMFQRRKERRSWKINLSLWRTEPGWSDMTHTLVLNNHQKKKTWSLLALKAAGDPRRGSPPEHPENVTTALPGLENKKIDAWAAGGNSVVFPKQKKAKTKIKKTWSRRQSHFESFFFLVKKSQLKGGMKRRRCGRPLQRRRWTRK